MSLNSFHPAVSRWFETTFGQATDVQRRAWPAIHSGAHTLIAAPTGSGKTLAAFLAAIDGLVAEGLANGLRDETHVLYVSPLKALSNDIQKNLQQPLCCIRDELLCQGLPDVPIEALVRTGDTPQTVRERMRRKPPHILVTTPESLYILLSADSGRQMLKTVGTVIVDEIHALAGNKRGAHLTLSLERLAQLCRDHRGQAPTRVGISATQKPIDAIARFLTGTDATDCTIVDTGYTRQRDLALEVPDSPLEAVMANEVWQEIYSRLEQLIEQHRTTLIFVNTRRLAERAARFLAERIGEEHVTAHHGSLAKEHRLDAETRLKAGKLRALVATSALELGIDIGDVDLVCQLGSPRAIAAFLQRVGRSGHAVDGVPKGRLFPLSRDDLVECTALLDAVNRQELDRIVMLEQPLDVLAQQLVAEVGSREWPQDALYDLVRRAWLYRGLTRETFDNVVTMLAQGYATRRGRRSAYLHHDAVNGLLRPRRGAKLTAITNGGAIPDQFDYDVVLEPEGVYIGSLNEDFAFESLPGDIFQLGNISYRMLKIEQGKVYVEDAQGLPPNIPFWFGEGVGRTDELSAAVSRLRQTIADKLESGLVATQQWLADELALPEAAARQLTEYLGAANAALGVMPTQETIVLERFFDEMGDMHLVIHAPFGARINRAWGLSLRKRFCRKFNFELQAAANEDSLVMSLGPTHSFVLSEVADYLKAATVRNVLTQALLNAPLFDTRWRWAASIALAIKRNRNGKKVPAQFQRTDAEDLIAVIFPDQLACLENVVGDREVPDHPLVHQALADCMHEAMDIDGLERILQRLESGELKVHTCELTHPSPLAQEIINARPYAFLDDAPAEERRTLAIQQRRYIDPQSAADLGRLDPAAIARVRAEAWPDPRNADELHDGLCVLGFVSETEMDQVAGWRTLRDELVAQRRITRLTLLPGKTLWVAAERLGTVLAAFPERVYTPRIPDLDRQAADMSFEQAMVELLRSRLEGLGPVTVEALAAPLGLAPDAIAPALLALEQEGFAIQGRFSAGVQATEWCERGLLARIHRYTLKRLRAEVEPVSSGDFMRFLFRWQRLDGERGEGPEALAAVLEQLEGFAISAAAWEEDILPARLQAYTTDQLDGLCLSGQLMWLRTNTVKSADKGKRKSGPVRNTPIVLVSRPHSAQWRALAGTSAEESTLSSSAAKILELLQRDGASFFVDLVQGSGMLRVQVEDALGALVTVGRVTSDSFAGLRALIQPSHRRAGFGNASRRRRGGVSLDSGGRWSLLHGLPQDNASGDVEYIARVLLRRYGVVFRSLLARENNLPPWRELLYVYRRLEARGEIRGGRFVQGFSGEQFALPEAVGSLREVRKQPRQGDLTVVCAVDPVNLTGIVTPGQKVPAQPHNRIVYRDGAPLAITVGGDVRYLEDLNASSQWQVRNLLMRKLPGQVTALKRL